MRTFRVFGFFAAWSCFFSVAAIAQPAYTTGDEPICSDRDAIEEAAHALAAKDRDWLEAIPGCILPAYGLVARIVRRDGNFILIRILDRKARGSLFWANLSGIKEGGSPREVIICRMPDGSTNGIMRQACEADGGKPER